MKLLVAVRDRNLSLALLKYFRERHWEVFPARDDERTLAQALKEQPQLILICSHLTGGTAVTLKKLRASPATADIPVVLLLAPGEDVGEWLMEGVTLCLEANPANLTPIEAAVRRYAKRSPSATKAAATDRVAQPLPASEIQYLDAPPSPMLDRLLALIASVVDVPVVLFQAVDWEKLRVRSEYRVGDGRSEESCKLLDHRFGQWVVTGEERLEFGSAKAHQAVRDALTLRDLGEIAYIGVPLTNSNHKNIGTLCAIDLKGRDWRKGDLKAMQALARIAQGQLILDHLQHMPDALPRHVGNPLSMRTLCEAMVGAASLLRRRGAVMSEDERELLYERIEAFGLQLQHFPQERRKRRRD